MPITIRCPKCGAEYEVPEDRAGKVGRCTCGEIIGVASGAPDASIARPPEVIRGLGEQGSISPAEGGSSAAEGGATPVPRFPPEADPLVIRIRCAKCGAEYQVPKGKSGYQGRCRCGELVAIPTEVAAQPVLDTPKSLEHGTDHAPSTGAHRKPRPASLWVAAVAGALVVAALGVTVRDLAGPGRAPASRPTARVTSPAGGIRPAKLSLVEAIRDGSGLVMKVRLDPGSFDLSSAQLVTVYLHAGQQGLSPEKVFADCDKMGIYVGPEGSWLCSTVTVKGSGDYVGQVEMGLHPQKIVTAGGILRRTLSPAVPGVKYRGRGTVYVWLRKANGPAISNTLAVPADFGAD